MEKFYVKKKKIIFNHEGLALFNNYEEVVEQLKTIIRSRIESSRHLNKLCEEVKKEFFEADSKNKKIVIAKLADFYPEDERKNMHDYIIKHREKYAAFLYANFTTFTVNATEYENILKALGGNDLASVVSTIFMHLMQKMLSEHAEYFLTGTKDSPIVLAEDVILTEDGNFIKNGKVVKEIAGEVFSIVGFKSDCYGKSGSIVRLSGREKDTKVFFYDTEEYEKEIRPAVEVENFYLRFISELPDLLSFAEIFSQTSVSINYLYKKLGIDKFIEALDNDLNKRAYPNQYMLPKICCEEESMEEDCSFDNYSYLDTVKSLPFSARKPEITVKVEVRKDSIKFSIKLADGRDADETTILYDIDKSTFSEKVVEDLKLKHKNAVKNLTVLRLMFYSIKDNITVSAGSEDYDSILQVITEALSIANEMESDLHRLSEKCRLTLRIFFIDVKIRDILI